MNTYRVRDESRTSGAAPVIIEADGMVVTHHGALVFYVVDLDETRGTRTTHAFAPGHWYEVNTV